MAKKKVIKPLKEAEAEELSRSRRAKQGSVSQ
jgi:hypothetical protein